MTGNLWPWLAVLTGFVIAAAAGALLLPLLARMRMRQHAYEDAPQTHRSKSGTPTMGGLVFVAALIPLLYLGGRAADALFALVAVCAAIGFIDDYTAIRKGKNAGLRARTKYLLTALAAVTFLRFGFADGANAGVLLRAGTFVLSAPYWLWLLLGILAVSGTIHAVNLTDGLDGLATGTMVPPLVILAVASLLHAQPVAPAYAALLGVGACFGFLLYNRHPAKMFMGDTGSLALGALLSGAAILSGQMLLLILIGGVFVAEALSVIVQVAYFKRTGGKRILRMSPLHHHFELSGWPETVVTSRFWLISTLLSGIGLALVR